MTRIAAVSLLLLSLATSPALAGRIFRDIQMDGKAAVRRVPVQVSQPPPPMPGRPGRRTTLTDRAGAYKPDGQGRAEVRAHGDLREAARDPRRVLVQGGDALYDLI